MPWLIFLVCSSNINNNKYFGIDVSAGFSRHSISCLCFPLLHHNRYSDATFDNAKYDMYVKLCVRVYFERFRMEDLFWALLMLTWMHTLIYQKVESLMCTNHIGHFPTLWIWSTPVQDPRRRSCMRPNVAQRTSITPLRWRGAGLLHLQSSEPTERREHV